MGHWWAALPCPYRLEAVLSDLQGVMPEQYVATDKRSGLEVAVTGDFPEHPDDRVRIARTCTLFTRLVATILGTVRFRPEATAYAVGLFISAGYWFTSSTSFANPAVTIARSLTDSFSGIAPAHAPGFILAQLAGAVAATLVFGWLLKERDR